MLIPHGCEAIERCAWCQCYRWKRIESTARPSRFCDNSCRNKYHAAVRKLGQQILAQGAMSLEDLKFFIAHPDSCRLAIEEYRGAHKLTVHAIFDGAGAGD